jgi:hypothetical protein
MKIRLWILCQDNGDGSTSARIFKRESDAQDAFLEYNNESYDRLLSDEDISCVVIETDDYGVVNG